MDTINPPLWFKNLVNINYLDMQTLRHPYNSSQNMNALFESVKNEGFNYVDFWLSQIDMNAVNISVLVTVLRSLFSMKHSLYQWKILQNKASQELIKRGINPNIMMRGLE